MRITTSALTILVVLFTMALSSTAWAGPVEDAASDIKKVVGAVKGTPSAAVVTAVRRAHAHYTVARRAKDAGKGKVAKAHALAARAEVRKVAESVGVTLAPLSAEQVAAKAKDTADFKAALGATPKDAKIAAGRCTAPDYGWGCCWPGGSPCSGTCCYAPEICGDHQCRLTGGDGTGGDGTTTPRETEGSN